VPIIPRVCSLVLGYPIMALDSKGDEVFPLSRAVPQRLVIVVD
jgi:hypothetical protein